MPFTMLCSWYALGQRDSQVAPNLGGQVVGMHGVVGVADLPELLWVAEVARGHVVEPVALGHDMLLEQRESLGRRDEAPPQVGDRLAIGVDERRHVDPVVSAAGR